MDFILVLVVTLIVLIFAVVIKGYGIQPTDQCVSQIYYLSTQTLQSGRHRYYWLEFTEAGAVHLVIRANVSSNVPVKLTIHAHGQEIWATQLSTRIAGTYTVDLKAPGAYQLVVKNPSSATARLIGFLNVTMCGGPAVKSWLGRFIKLTMKNVVLNDVKVSMAPMGIASYGVMEVGGQYFTYTLTTDVVKGVVDIPPNISVFSYLEWWDGNHYFGETFSVQLNAFVVARLVDGMTQYYWIQNTIIFDGRYKLKVRNNIWNTTDETLTLIAIKGNGNIVTSMFRTVYVYEPLDIIPFGRVELETWVHVDDGKIIIEFYANGRRYDEVIIRPYAPAVSAHITIAPTTTPVGLPLNLELVLGGPNGLVPWTILYAGRIGLELYVRANDSWIPLPSAWSVGIVTYERSCARVVPQGVGSVAVVPGIPNPRQLWALVATSGPNIDVMVDNNVESTETYVDSCPVRPPSSNEWQSFIYFITVTIVLSIILYIILSVIEHLRR